MSIYIHNKYYNIYFSIINKSLSENRSKKDDRIYEIHHIIPKSCEGSNEPSNLILLTPKEHYICHRLLPKMVKSKLHYEKMIYALWSLVNRNGHSERHSPSGKIYQHIKEEQSKVRSERMKGEGNHFYGKTHTKEVKFNLSKNNPAKRLDVRQKMSISAKEKFKKGYKNHNALNGWSDETKKKISEANRGKTLSTVTRNKMSETRKKKIWIKKEGEKSKHIHIEAFDDYEKIGWSRGRGKLK